MQQFKTAKKLQLEKQLTEIEAEILKISEQYSAEVARENLKGHTRLRASTATKYKRDNLQRERMKIISALNFCAASRYETASRKLLTLHVELMEVDKNIVFYTNTINHMSAEIITGLKSKDLAVRKQTAEDLEAFKEFLVSETDRKSRIMKTIEKQSAIVTKLSEKI